MNPLWILASLIGGLAALAWCKQVYPHRPLLGLLTVPVAAAMLLVVVPGAFWWLVGADMLVGVIVVVDLLTVPPPEELGVQRQLGRIASIGKPHRVTLTIANQSLWDREVSVRDDVASDLDADPDMLHTQLPPRSRTRVSYDLIPRRRGAFALYGVHVRWTSRLGLWKRHHRYPVVSRVNVYPDMQQLSEYGLLARTNRLSLLGVRRTRKPGGDTEFERLRDYRRDDQFKHIDWRATARRHKLTVREFRTNQSQRVVFLVDCGRMMTGRASGLSLLDHALNAMLMMSYVALKQGDQVGLICFSDQVHGFVPPRGGMKHTNNLLHTCFDRFPTLVESRYDRAFLYLAANCRKRALVVLITNIIDQVNANQVEQHLANLSGRHLPLGVLMRDRSVFDALQWDERGEQIFRSAAAADVLAWRHQVLADLQSRGVLTLDVFPERLAAPLVNQYLDVKARHLL